MKKARCFCVSFLILLSASLLPLDAFAYWPLVFQVSKNGSDFASSQGPLQLRDTAVGVYQNQTMVSSVVTYTFVLREYDSFSEEVLKGADVYVQMYPADVMSYEYGRKGDVYFNGATIEQFNLTQRYGKGVFLDKSNYRFGHTSLGFPIPMYNYLSNESLFIAVPVSLLSASINLTFKMGPNVLWELYVVSVIVRINPEAVTPWWRENLQAIYAVVSLELICLGLILVRFTRHTLKRKGLNTKLTRGDVITSEPRVATSKSGIELAL